MECAHVENQEFVLVKMSRATRDVILISRFNIDRIVTAASASQMETDGSAVFQMFRDRSVFFETMYYLSEVGRLLFGKAT